MFACCRATKRLCWGKLLYIHLVHARSLSGADAVNALRPFYFAVHPDFFGQHPREREVNENSLKRLNGYLENIQKPGLGSHKPAQLTFYVRGTVQNPENDQASSRESGFRTVSFTLDSRDLLSTVLGILNSCSLSTDHVQSSSDRVGSTKTATSSFYRPIKWDKTFYSFTGYKDPEKELEQAQKTETTINSWIQSNQEVAQKKLNNSIPLREELERLKTELSDKLQLSNVRERVLHSGQTTPMGIKSLKGAVAKKKHGGVLSRPMFVIFLLSDFNENNLWIWQRSWGIAHRCGQLHSLGRLIKHNCESLKMAKGHTVIFTDRTGMSAAGHVMLGTMDVHHHWTKLFERLPSYYVLQGKLLQLQDRISHVLGGIDIVHIEELQPLLTMEEYYSVLDAFCKKLLNRRVPIHPRSLRGLQMILENDHYVPRLHEMGHFIIPTVCDPPSLQWFLLAHAPKAREKLKKKEELKSKEQELTDACKDSASLSRLYKEPSVSCEQMISCCQRLIEEPQPSLVGMHLCVSHYYSVLQDGDLCIPWNWKS
ncbi:T-cell activation inhibitor, mitochondrial isoform X1 [Phyllobates terribilis]|uniref:T-cell activation inhibitor, mitochondrial isoform X1 n=1 Tax=Phyllobates terribilis TaxID=111132 RepID=UPI003CCB37DA